MAATPPDKPTDAEKAAEEQEKVDEAATAPQAERELTARDKLTDKARDAELERQDDVAEAVAKAGAKDLPKIGGPMLEPGLGR